MTVFSHVALGTRHSRYTAQYLPKPIRSMLLSLKKNERFQNQRWQAVILMSDLVGYTTVTSLLRDPALIFNLLNKYLESTTIMLQDKYDGWLEGYVGDLFCYYWPQMEGLTIKEQIEKSLHAAIELKKLQKEFFRNLPNLDLPIPREASEKIAEIVNAGIGICSGEVVAGNVGPKGGVQKFGLLGDPLNLSSRLEALTRLFDTEIIISEELAPTAEELGYRVRKIASVKVKGRLDVTTLYAMGETDDSRFSDELVKKWEEFWNRLQQTGEVLPWNFEALRKDHETLVRWHKQGLYDP
ncbi:MAG: adenylate/guanylate cyclase domain-containing protein, partial [Pseudomonadales bacterium]